MGKQGSASCDRSAPLHMALIRVSLCGLAHTISSIEQPDLEQTYLSRHEHVLLNMIHWFMLLCRLLNAERHLDAGLNNWMLGHCLERVSSIVT